MPLSSSLAKSCLADVALGYALERRLVGEQERQVEGFEFLRAERSELRQRRGEHLHGPQLQGLHLFLVLVELAGRIDLNGDLAVGVFLRKFLELVCALALRRRRRDDVAELDDDIGRPRTSRAGQQHDGCRSK